LGEITHYMYDRGMVKYNLGGKLAHELTVNNVSKADADLINGWRVANSLITYTPDTDVAGTTYTVQIMNTTAPLQWMGGYPIADTKFEGTISIRRV